jgi:hypothetical protein
VTGRAAGQNGSSHISRMCWQVLGASSERMGNLLLLGRKAHMRVLRESKGRYQVLGPHKQAMNCADTAHLLCDQGTGMLRGVIWKPHLQSNVSCIQRTGSPASG